MSGRYWSLPGARYKAELSWLCLAPGLLLLAVSLLLLNSSRLPWFVSLLLSGLVCWYAVDELRSLNRRLGSAWIAEFYWQAGEWRARLADGGEVRLELVAPVLLSQHLLAAHFINASDPRATFRLFLLPAAVSPECWRRLCLCLRYGGAED